MTSESGEVRESVGAKRICPYPHLVAFLQLYPTRCSTWALGAFAFRFTIAKSEDGAIFDNARMKCVPVVNGYGPIEEINTIVRRGEDASFPIIPVPFVQQNMVKLDNIVCRNVHKSHRGSCLKRYNFLFF